MKMVLINGPNLNLLGYREPETYGYETLDDIVSRLREKVPSEDLLSHRQSNSEGDIVSFIQDEGRDADYIIINAAAYTHTSVAIRDTLLAVAVPVI